jgi:hypothetical protein
MLAHSPLLRPAAALAILCGLLANASAAPADPPDLGPVTPPVFHAPGLTAPTANPGHPGPVTFKPWGAIVSFDGSVAKASTKRAGKRDDTGFNHGASDAGASSAPAALTFKTPSDLREKLVTDQTVYLGSDGKTVGVVTFPIAVPSTETTVGRAGGTFGDKGKFDVTTTDMQVFNTGVISGTTKVFSESYTNGFQGGVAVQLLDASGTPLEAPLPVGCWGVNMRSGRTTAWSVQVPASAAAQTATVKLYQYNACGGSNLNADLTTAASVATIVGTIVAIAVAL